jgi:formylglycine-generating enzyme required for sulfatase activity
MIGIGHATRCRAIALTMMLVLLLGACGRGEPTATPEPPTSTPLSTATEAVRLASTPTATQTPKPPPASTNAPLALTSAQAPFQTWTRPSDGAVMVYVPGGTFEMGSTEAEIDAALDLCAQHRGNGGCPDDLFNDESPLHSVTLDAFWIDRTEVTNAQYWSCVAAGACAERQCTSEWLLHNPDQPIVCVRWEDAEAYCQWAGGRLPTEAEWEYAARGPERNIFPWGNAFDSTRLNYCDLNCTYRWRDEDYDDGHYWPGPVGSYLTGVSWCGALDMAGNAWEWVADWYDAEYYVDSPPRNPQGPDSGHYRVMRGGSCFYFPSYARSARRAGVAPSGDTASGGFRCAMTSMSSSR